MFGSIMNASTLNELRSVVNRKVGCKINRNPKATKPLCFFLKEEGLNGSEIGLVLGISRQAVWVHLSKSND